MSVLAGRRRLAISIAAAVVIVLVAIAAVAYLSRERGEVLVGAGDIAGCSYEADEATASLLDDIGGTVMTLGDNAYHNGTAAEFRECYEPTWGRHKDRTRPAPGNHEYYTSNASAYFDYFGEAAGDPDKGYYSYDLGEWHVIVLNSDCNDDMGGCDGDSPMVRWLREDLDKNPAPCTLAYWHNPLFSSGEHGNQDRTKPFWRALHEANADVVVNGHDHSYERFAPQDPDGVADPEQGIRQFVVGTGGVALRPFGEAKPNSEVRNNGTHGVLKLDLKETGYDWEFVPVEGETFTDSGSGDCH